jgi:hypothetical protein
MFLRATGKSGGEAHAPKLVKSDFVVKHKLSERPMCRAKFLLI